MKSKTLMLLTGLLLFSFQPELRAAWVMPPTGFGEGEQFDGIVIDSDQFGNAIVAVSLRSGIEASRFSGGVWSTPTVFDTGLGGDIALDVDSLGTALTL